MQIDLNDKVALVTGAAHRVGRAIALELAKNGVNIMVHYHHSDQQWIRQSAYWIDFSASSAVFQAEFI